jgi:hypothetical protein
MVKANAICHRRYGGTGERSRGDQGGRAHRGEAGPRGASRSLGYWATKLEQPILAAAGFQPASAECEDAYVLEGVTAKAEAAYQVVPASCPVRDPTACRVARCFVR